MVFHGFQVGKQRGHTLVDDEWVGGIVGRKTHPDGGEAGDRFQKQLKVLVGRFALPTSGLSNLPATSKVAKAGSEVC